VHPVTGPKVERPSLFYQASFFGSVHPRFRMPWKATILTGSAVGLMGALLPLRMLAQLVNIGTLLAFAIVCAAVI
jgi:basic amino acid/polyamine antiporter, APA family